MEILGNPTDDIRTVLTKWMSESRFTVVLSGAGMSTESGIPDFRSEGGIWENSDLLRAMSNSYLTHHPELFWPKYKKVFLQPAYRRAQPNAGHVALSTWEKEGQSLHIYTQNVDGLHQEAGNQHVSELHGSARHAHCPRCHTHYGLEAILAEEVPRCTWETPKGAICDTILHPDTVLFEQAVRHLDSAITDVSKCDLLLILGTSLTVEPVASLPKYRSRSSRLVIVNLDSTYLDGEADLVVHARIGHILPGLVNR